MRVHITMCYMGVGTDQTNPFATTRGNKVIQPLAKITLDTVTLWLKI